MHRALASTLRLLRLAVALGLVGLCTLAAAIATASMRFGVCGPSSLDSADAYCRAGMQWLVVAYALLALALVLGAACLTRIWRLRRRPG